MIGRTLAHYEITALLGRGGMGEVYRARDTNLDRDVALKVLPAEVADDPKRLERLRREAKTLAAVDHPGIVTLFSVEEDTGTHFLTMELLEGLTLDQMLTAGGLPLARILEIGIAVADAVAAAHDAHIVHRDLKPSNVAMTRSGRVKVLDFGLAKWTFGAGTADTDATRSLALTGEGETLGTLPYMSPEQISGEPVDARTDVFALGAILYELATGRRPFQGQSAASVASAILRDEPERVTTLREDLPGDLSRIIRRCLEKSLDRRMQTARDIRNELEDLRRELDSQSDRRPEPKPGSEALIEGRWTITIDHVRGLTTQLPAMIGDSMTYLDNCRDSDVLVFCLHGIGSDQTDFEDLLRNAPYRAIAPSLYGFGPTARLRPALPVVDHDRLLVAFLEDTLHRLAPKTSILIGHSSGSDQFLQILSGEDYDRICPDALVALGPTIKSGPGFVSGPYSKLTDEPTDILRAIQSVSTQARDLDDWLASHEYLVRAFRKFRFGIAPLRQFAIDLMAMRADDAFFELFRQVAPRIPLLRFVIALEETDERDYALQRHLQDNVLGGNFSEEMFVDAPAGHIDLKNASVVVPLLEELVSLAR